MPLSLPSDAVRQVSNTSLYQVSLLDELILVTPSGAQTEIQLYSGAVHTGTGKTVSIKNEGPGKLVLTATNGTVDGANTYYIEVSQVISVISDGTNWLISSNDDLTHQIEDTSANNILSIDWTLGKNHMTTLTENVSVNLVGGKPGGHYTLVLWQDGSGNNSFSFGNNVVWSGNVTPFSTYTPGSADLYAFYFDGGAYIGAGSLYTIVG